MNVNLTPTGNYSGIKQVARTLINVLHHTSCDTLHFLPYRWDGYSIWKQRNAPCSSLPKFRMHTSTAASVIPSAVVDLFFELNVLATLIGLHGPTHELYTLFCMHMSVFSNCFYSRRVVTLSSCLERNFHLCSAVSQVPSWQCTWSRN